MALHNVDPDVARPKDAVAQRKVALTCDLCVGPAWPDLDRAVNRDAGAYALRNRHPHTRRRVEMPRTTAQPQPAVELDGCLWNGAKRVEGRFTSAEYRPEAKSFEKCPSARQPAKVMHRTR